MHELEGKIYDLFEAGKFPGKKANKLLECLNQTRVMQQYFIKTADQQGFVELNAQNESYLAEGFMALHLVIFSVGEVSQ